MGGLGVVQGGVALEPGFLLMNRSALQPKLLEVRGLCCVCTHSLIDARAVCGCEHGAPRHLQALRIPTPMCAGTSMGPLPWICGYSHPSHVSDLDLKIVTSHVLTYEGI